MSHLGSTPFEQAQKRDSLLGKLRIHSTIFIVACALIPIVYLLFQFGLVGTKPAQANAELEQAVCLVTTADGTGTAFLISSTKLLTARHVVENLSLGTSVTLTFERVNPSITTTATLVWKDETAYVNPGLDYFLTDVAVLELTTPDVVADIMPLELGDSDPVKPLDKVILLGYPGSDFSATTGTINNQRFNGLELFKLDATANPGNSGGPCILEEDNTVIGMLVGGNNITQSENIANKVGNIRGLLEKAGVGLD